jgi:small subunit ribosomal protein S20
VAQHKSAEKRAVQSVKRNLGNRSYMSKVKTAVKKFQVAVAGLKEGKTALDVAQKTFIDAQSHLMKAATKHVIHKNNASRHIARLSKMLVKSQQK